MKTRSLVKRCTPALLGAVLLVAFLCGGPLRAYEKPEDIGPVAAKRWLELVDSGKYGPSWERASTLFKAGVGKAQWEQTVAAVRAQTGNVKLRELKASQATKTLPGAPPGEYVVMQFTTAFEKKPSAIETVVVMLDADNEWRVSGYFVK